jgi:hypothetical protein
MFGMLNTISKGEKGAQLPSISKKESILGPITDKKGNYT